MIIPILGKILGSGDVVQKGMELIDSMHTSTEEQIKAQSDARIQLINAYQPFKLAQRYIALMFTFTFISCFAITMGMTLAGKGDIEGVKAILGDFWIGEIMLLIVGFYFGGGLAETIKRKK